MKKFLTLILLLLVQGYIFAAGADFHGGILAALNETDPRIRAGRIIDALENSSESKCSVAALAVLSDDLILCAPDETLLSRLTALMKKYPAEWKIAILAGKMAQLNRTYTDELVDNMQKFLMDADFSTLPEKSELSLNMLVHCANFRFNRAKDYRNTAKFFNQLVNKNPRSAQLLRAAAVIQINNGFRACGTAPGLPGYEKLAATDIWKSSLNSIAAKLENAEVKSAADANAVVTAALLLKHPETAGMLKKYSSAFPGSNWSTLSAIIARDTKTPALFIPGKNIMQNFNGYLTVKDFSAARKIIRNYNAHVRNNLDIILKNAEDRHHEVAELVHSPAFKFQELFHESLNALITSVHIVKDKKAAEKLLKATVDDIEKNGGKYSGFITCNAIGYVAADLDIALSDAEKLIRTAVHTLPEEASFRDSLAWVLFRQGRYAEAEKEIDAALENCSAGLSSSVIYLHAAQIKFSCGRPVEARKMLNRAKALYLPDAKECSEYDINIQKNLENLLK